MSSCSDNENVRAHYSGSTSELSSSDSSQSDNNANRPFLRVYFPGNIDLLSASTASSQFIASLSSSSGLFSVSSGELLRISPPRSRPLADLLAEDRISKNGGDNTDSDDTRSDGVYKRAMTIYKM